MRSGRGVRGVGDEPRDLVPRCVAAGPDTRLTMDDSRPTGGRGGRGAGRREREVGLLCSRVTGVRHRLPSRAG